MKIQFQSTREVSGLRTNGSIKITEVKSLHHLPNIYLDLEVKSYSLRRANLRQF